MPVIVAPAGTVKPVPLASINCVELAVKEAVANAEEFTKSPGFVQGAPDPCVNTEDGAVGPALVLTPEVAEA
jgi:hypothetical protein